MAGDLVSPAFAVMQEHAADLHLKMRQCFEGFYAYRNGYDAEPMFPSSAREALRLQRELYLVSATERLLRGVE